MTTLAALLLLALLTWQVAAHGVLRTGDERLAVLLRRHAPAGPFAELLADLGNMTVALPLLAVTLAAAVWRSRQWAAALSCGLAMAAVPLCVSLLKGWLARPGPLGGTGYYPSGHAATAAVALGAAAVLLCNSGTGRARWLLPTVAVGLTVLNGAGLVWRGYHWPLDVLASWCLGWLLLVTAAHLRRCGPTPGHRKGSGTGSGKDTGTGSSTSCSTGPGPVSERRS